jgi:hypothetical protein
MSQKAAAVLGSVLEGSSIAEKGSPTVLAANGLICVGMGAGRVYVFDFKQNLKAICGGTEASGASI